MMRVWASLGFDAPGFPQYRVITVPNTVDSVSISANFTPLKQILLAPDFRQTWFGFSYINTT